MRRDMADNEKLYLRPFGNPDGLGDTFPGSHTSDDDKKVLRRIVEGNLLQVNPVIDRG